ncbi:MAG: hypothetical protein Q7T03_02230 [Deltaproteobacteria bacterium]|nr:hypothetical protein [Deltaproteobacteria bacterium]
MTETAKLNLTRFSWGVKVAYGNEALAQAYKVFGRYGLQKTVDVYQESAGNSTILIPYVYKAGDQSVLGLLRFSEDGSVRGGLGKNQDELPAAVGQFLVAAVAGEKGLTAPMDEDQAVLLKGAMQIYECQFEKNFQAECVEPGKQKIAEAKRRRNNEKSEAVLTLADQLMEVAEKQDKGWFKNNFGSGSDASDIRNDYNKFSDRVEKIEADSLDGSVRRLATAEKMFQEMISDGYGPECVDLKQCTTEVETPDCDDGYKADSKTTYFYKGAKVYANGSGECKKIEEKKEKDSDDWCGKHPAHCRAVMRR